MDVVAFVRSESAVLITLVFLAVLIAVTLAMTARSESS
jgi:hypothetical protein